MRFLGLHEIFRTKLGQNVVFILLVFGDSGELLNNTLICNQNKFEYILLINDVGASSYMVIFYLITKT